MVFHDIETNDMIVPPYFIISRNGREVYMNLLTFQERVNSYNHEAEMQKIFMPCNLEIVDSDEEHYPQGFNLLPKRFFLRTFCYFNGIKPIEEILLN